MRADLGPYAVDAMLALAGFGILLASGLVRWRLVDLLGALGLAYLTGAAAVPLILVFGLVLGIPFTLVTFTLVALACIGAATLRLRGRGVRTVAGAFRGWIPRLGPWRSWPPGAWIIGAFVVLFGSYAMIGLLSASDAPLSAWDAWSIWARKAQMLTVNDSLVSGFFTSPSYAFTHLDYPLQYPVWEALHFRGAAVFDTNLILAHVWLLFVAFVWSAAYLLRRQVVPAVWAPVLLLVAASPGVWQQVLSGYADLPMAMFACVAAVSLGLWIMDGDGKFLVLAVIMLGATANMKNEGMVTAVAMLVVAGAITVACRLDRASYVIALCATVLTIVPWRVWVAAHGIIGDMPVSKGLDPSYLLGRTGRVWPSIKAICAQLADQGRWLYLLPLAALVVAASLVSGVGRRAAAFYLGSFAAVWAALVWSYWISPHELAWHLSTSVDRVVSAPMLICVAALLHLSGLLLAALGGKTPRIGGASGRG